MIKILGRFFNVLWIAAFIINTSYVLYMIHKDIQITTEFTQIFFATIFGPLILSFLLLNWGTIAAYERFRRYIVDGKDFFGKIKKDKDGE